MHIIQYVSKWLSMQGLWYFVNTWTCKVPVYLIPKSSDRIYYYNITYNTIVSAIGNYGLSSCIVSYVIYDTHPTHVLMTLGILLLWLQNTACTLACATKESNRLRNISKYIHTYRGLQNIIICRYWANSARESNKTCWGDKSHFGPAPVINGFCGEDNNSNNIQYITKYYCTSFTHYPVNILL